MKRIVAVITLVCAGCAAHQTPQTVSSNESGAGSEEVIETEVTEEIYAGTIVLDAEEATGISFRIKDEHGVCYDVSYERAERSIDPERSSSVDCPEDIWNPASAMELGVRWIAEDAEHISAAIVAYLDFQTRIEVSPEGYCERVALPTAEDSEGNPVPVNPDYETLHIRLDPNPSLIAKYGCTN